MQFAADSLLGAFTFFNTASRGPVQDKTGSRIQNFRDEKCISAPNEAQGSLSGFDFHVALLKSKPKA
jgi:hypothetical protein